MRLAPSAGPSGATLFLSVLEPLGRLAAFILAALCFAFGLPRTLERSAETA
jgi:hypothetical protein